MGAGFLLLERGGSVGGALSQGGLEGSGQTPGPGVPRALLAALGSSPGRGPRAEGTKRGPPCGLLGKVKHHSPGQGL